MKSKASVNVYLLLLKEDKILLSFRENTGYEDNKWSFVAGGQEVGESATETIIREALEEIGIKIQAKNLKVSHVMHRKTNQENIDIFMECRTWIGEISNKEPQKCGGLEFFDINHLPENTVEYVKYAVKSILSGEIYSEFGWKDGKN